MVSYSLQGSSVVHVQIHMKSLCFRPILWRKHTTSASDWASQAGSESVHIALSAMNKSILSDTGYMNGSLDSVACVRVVVSK